MKKLIILLNLLTLAVMVSAQSPFKGFFKPVESFEQPYSLGAMSVASDMWLFRPSAAITAVQMNWNKTSKAFDASAFSSAGLGIGYQHFIKTDTEPFNNYGFNLLLLIGKQVATEEATTEASMSLAVVFSALKWINLGPIYDFGSKKVGILTGVSLTF